MAIAYDVFLGDGAGGPPDYTSPVATTSGTTLALAPLAAPGDWWIGVRARDTVTGLSDENVDVLVRLRLAAGGANITGLPNAPSNLTARATAAGTAVARWTYNPAGQGGRPTGFAVYRGTPAVSYTTPVATVPYSAGAVDFMATLTGLADGVAYEVGVRGVNATGTEANTITVSVTGRVAGPDPVEGLTATAVAVG